MLRMFAWEVSIVPWSREYPHQESAGVGPGPSDPLLDVRPQPGRHDGRQDARGRLGGRDLRGGCERVPDLIGHPAVGQRCGAKHPPTVAGTVMRERGLLCTLLHLLMAAACSSASCCSLMVRALLQARSARTRRSMSSPATTANTPEPSVARHSALHAKAQSIILSLMMCWYTSSADTQHTNTCCRLS